MGSYAAQMARDAERLRGELAEAQRDHTDMMWQRRRADERAEAAEARIVTLENALRNARHAAAGGTALKSTADLLRWLAPRAFATHGETDVPTERDILERAAMLDAATDMMRGALDGSKPSAAPDFTAGVEQMLAWEQAGGDGWWKGWEMLKAAYAKAECR